MIHPWLADPVGVTLNVNIDASGILRLDLCDNPFSELDPLTTMPDLADLTLNNTGITCAEIEEFKAAAPGVIVTTDLNCP